MAEADVARPEVFLHPGEIFGTEQPVRVKTIVGSCVAIVLRAPRLGLAAMAHCVLPEAEARAAVLPAHAACRYVDVAIELMLGAFTSRGVTVVELEVKLFGGAGRLEDGSAERGYQVGRRNVKAAQSALAAHGLCIAASDTGGSRGRVIEFDTATGEVWVKRLPAGRTWSRKAS
jgi:chemotaxis protein CheD